MKKNKVKIIGAIAIVLVLTLGIALSYAFFSASDKQTQANTFRSGCLNITIESESDAITLNNAYPVSDLEGIDSKGYTFTIKNTCNKDTNYMINLESLNQVSNSLNANYLKVALESDTMDNLISKLGDNPTTDPMITGAYESHNLYNGNIKANTSKEFTLREWIDYDVTKEQGMNKTVTNKINVIARPDLNVNELNIKSNIEGTTLTGTLTSNVTDVKYCISDKNICEPNTNTSVTDKNVTINNLEDKRQLICTKLNNDKVYCIKKYKSLPILANEFLRNNANATDFESITVLDKINIPNNAIRSWDASEANNGSVMAYYLDENGNGLSELYLAGDGGVAAPKDSSYLFSDSSHSKPFSNVTTINLSKLNTKNVTNMESMFAGMSSITSLDVSNFNTSNVTNMNSMFYYTYDLTCLDLSSFDTKNVTNMNSMFDEMVNLTSLDLSSFDTSNVTDMGWMFAEMKNITILDITNFDTSNVTNMSYMFFESYSLISVDVSHFNTTNVTDMRSMFCGMSGLTSIDVSNFNTSKVSNMKAMFFETESLTSLDVSNFDTSNVTDMRSMFCGMSGLTSIDVSNFNTSNVTDMSQMFRDMSGLTSLNISNFDTLKVTDMSWMFYNMLSLTSLDLSSFDFSKVTKYTDMFKSSSKINTIKVKDETARDFIEARLTDASLTGVTVNAIG